MLVIDFADKSAILIKSVFLQVFATRKKNISLFLFLPVMPLGVTFCFNAVWALEFIRKTKDKGSGKESKEKEEEDNIIFQCERGSSSVEISAMIREALVVFGKKDESWVVVVKCVDPFGGTTNHPISIAHFAQVFYLQRNMNCW